MKRFFTLFSIISAFGPLWAMTEEVTIMKSPTSSQGVWLSGGDHVRRPKDKQTLLRLIEIIKEVDAQPDSPEIPFYIFVENARDIDRRLLLPSGQVLATIDSGLVDYYADSPFEKSIVVCCEKRIKSGAAFDILALCRTNSNPIKVKEAFESLLRSCLMKIPRYVELCKKYYGSSLDEVAFQDVIDEFVTLEKEMLEYRNQWKDVPEAQERFDRNLRAARISFSSLEKYIQLHGCASKSILEYAIELEINTRTYLRDKITRAFGFFNDLFIFHKILLQQNKSIGWFVVFNGDDHIVDLRINLNCTNFNEIEHARNFELIDFDVLKRPISQLEATKRWYSLKYCTIL